MVSTVVNRLASASPARDGSAASRREIANVFGFCCRSLSGEANVVKYDGTNRWSDLISALLPTFASSMSWFAFGTTTSGVVAIAGRFEDY